MLSCWKTLIQPTQIRKTNYGSHAALLDLFADSMSWKYMHRKINVLVKCDNNVSC